MLVRLARFCYRRRRLVLLAWTVVLVGAITLSQLSRPAPVADFALPGSPSQAAATALHRVGLDAPDGEQARIVVSGDDVGAPAAQRTVAGVLAEITTEVPGVRISSANGPGNEQIAANGTVGYVDLTLAARPPQELAAAAADIRTAAAAASTAALRIEVGGDAFAGQGGFSTEALGLLAAVLILLVAFGSVLAMLLPVGTALFGVGTGVSLLALAGTVLGMPSFASYGAIMIGVGVGVDYALFIVTRYREGLAERLDPEAAALAAMGTAGRAVCFAGGTVVVSLLGLLLFGLAPIQGFAVGLALAVTAVVAAALTLLPALLGLTGQRIDRLRVRLPRRRRRAAAGSSPRRRAAAAEASPGWARFARGVTRRPWTALFGSLVVLAVLIVPVFALRLGFADAGNRPRTDTTRRAYDLVADGFGPGANGPLVLVADTGTGGSASATLDGLTTALHADPGVAAVTSVVADPTGQVAVRTVVPTTGPQDARTTALVHRLRDTVLPAAGRTVHVTGTTAAAVDFADYTAAQLPLLIGAVLVLCFLLLLIVFRSVLVALKAIVVNAASIGAAYGVVVAVFQWGWGGVLFGLDGTRPVEAWVPMIMFVLLFGLSMDYEVFLLSRIREAYDRDGDNGRAVVHGLSVTARVITAAAAIMVVVFSGFAFGADPALQVMGLGLAAGVLIDATLVRLVLVPAVLALLGDANWWLPGRLARLLPRVPVEPAGSGVADPVGVRA